MKRGCAPYYHGEGGLGWGEVGEAYLRLRLPEHPSAIFLSNLTISTFFSKGSLASSSLRCCFAAKSFVHNEF